jgi:hypothetical protein
MLVLISDTHLTDGTSGETIKVGAFWIFLQELRSMAYQASWRWQGKDKKPVYKPVDRVDVIMLGDILDVLRSTKWLKEDGQTITVRPWDNSQEDVFVGKVRSITQDIIEHNATSLAVLRKLKDGKTMTIPQAAGDGGTDDETWRTKTEGQVPVDVHLHYLVGNHDWFYHLPGPEYDGIRQLVVDALDLDNPPDHPFPHDLTESEVLSRVFEEHKVFARHGDIYDSYNFEGDRNRSSLGDAVVVELIDQFALRVREQLGHQLSKACLDGLREIDNLRPTYILPAWLAGLLDQTVPETALQKEVWSIWDELVNRFFRTAFVRQHHSAIYLLDNVTKLRLAFSLFHGKMSRTLAWMTLRWPALSARLFGGGGPSYRNAYQENAIRQGKACSVVYGHTHVYELVPLSRDQIYINSGTWRPYHELDHIDPEAEDFARYELMTYLAFFKENERNGRAYQVWNGVLGPTT